MKKINILLLFLVLGMNFSCKKTTFKKHFTVIVKDENSGRGIENCEVHLYQSYDGGLYFSEQYDWAQITDANGQVEFILKPFKNDNASDIQIFARIESSKYNNIYGIGNAVYSKSEIERKNNIDIITKTSPGFIKVYVHDEIPYSDSTLSIAFLANIQSAGKCYGQGCSVQYTYIIKGNTMIDITWRIYETGSSDYGTVYTDSIYCPAFETTDYYITF